MATLTSQKSLFGVDPTKGFIQYTQTVKPYHSKILEVLVEYVFNENIYTTIYENLDIDLDIGHPRVDIVSSYGFGAVWDAPFVVNEYPIVKIVKAVGDTPIEIMCYTDTLNPTHITISYNPDNYSINIDDPITVQTTGTMPSTTIGTISPGKIYYIISIDSNIIEISNTIAGTPLIFTTPGTGTIKIHQENLKYNSFLVEQQPPTQFKCVAFNVNSNQLAFVNVYDISDVKPSLRQWHIGGIDITDAIPGATIYIHDNSVGADGIYTIESVTEESIYTIITVVEPIPISAEKFGLLNIQNDLGVIPNWIIGTSVQVSSPVTLPSPLTSNTTYYFIPSNIIGCFNLSTKQVPLSKLDLVDITNLGVSYINIERSDLFYPGAVVKVDGTYLTRNDGTYYIRNVITEDPYLRVNVMQKVTRSTPTAIIYDGTMKLNTIYGYDYPNYGISLQASELYLDTFIDERLTFEFVLNLNEEISSLLFEDNGGIYDTKEFDIYTSITNANTIIPTGFDTQYFDIGVLDEDNHYNNHNLGLNI